MKVSELIEKLQELDPDLPVYVRGYEGGVDDVERVSPCHVERDYHSSSYFGDHELDEPRYLDNPTPGVFLGDRGLVIEPLAGEDDNEG